MAINIFRTSKKLVSLVLVFATFGGLASCSTQHSSNESRLIAANQFGSPRDVATASSIQMESEQEVLAAQQQRARKVEVTVLTRVFKLLPDDVKGLPHQRFLLQLDNGSTVLVAHDTKLAPYVRNLQPGDFVHIRGEYIWNERGGVIHWTHHDPNRRHEPGWIDFNGQRYQ